MNLPIEDDVKRILKPIEPLVYSAFKMAWGDWQKTLLAPRFARTRPTVLWEFIIRRADEAFSGVAGIERREKYSTVSYIIDDSLMFRFKKGDRNGFSRNFPTQRALDFNDQNISCVDDRQGLIFDDAYLPRVDIVYILNKLLTDIESIFVVARHKNRKLWDYHINPAPAVVQEFPLETKPKTPSTGIAVPKIPIEPAIETNTVGGPAEN